MKHRIAMQRLNFNGAREAATIAFVAVLAALLFSTQARAAEPPLAATDAATEVGADRATMNGRVNPKGSAVAVCRFEYGVTSSYGAALPCSPASLGTGTTSVEVSAETQQLEAGITYHYRVVATSANGTSQGGDRTFTTSGTPACSNSERRLEQGIQAIQLPDCMALEQVSPPKKLNQRAYGPYIAADGKRIAFRSLAVLAETPGSIGTLFGDTYVSTRDQSQGRWVPQPTVPPAGITTGWENGEPFARSFDPNLTRWFVLGSTRQEAQFERGIGQMFRGALGGAFEPISPVMNPSAEASALNVTSANLLGAADDHSLVVFRMGGSSSTTYLPGDPVVRGAGFDPNPYVAELDQSGQPSLQLLARDEVGGDAGTAWGGNCGARLGGIGGPGVGWRYQGAVSLSGDRIYLSARAAQPASGPCSESSKLRILQRVETGSGADISELIATECLEVPRACPGTGSADLASGSPLLTNLEVSGGAFEPGMTITGTGIPFGAKVVAVVSPTELEISANATSTSTGVALTANDGDDFYQGASSDQTKVYFTTNRQLTETDLDANTASCNGFFASEGCDLYLWDFEKDEGERLTQVSAGEENASHPVVGSGANVFNGTTAISGDGSRVYFVAAGVLTLDANPEGKTAAEYPTLDPKLYTWDTVTGEVTFLGGLAATPGDNDGLLWAGSGIREKGTFQNAAFPAPALGDGHVLAFQSKAPLTANDTDGAKLDVFRYDASASPPTLNCVSCRPGGPDGEAFDVFSRVWIRDPAAYAGTGLTEERRWVSEDGLSIVFTTDQSLTPDDQNGRRDDYLWRDGRLVRLPNPTGAPVLAGEDAPVVSRDGSQVAFTAHSPLLPTDIDTAPDVYVARVGGGFPPPPPTLVCVGESCQGPPTPGPGAVATGSEGLVGRGNVVRPPTPPSRVCPKGKRKVVRKGKVRCVKKNQKKRSKGRMSKGSNSKQGGQK